MSSRSPEESGKSRLSRQGFQGQKLERIMSFDLSLNLESRLLLAGHASFAAPGARIYVILALFGAQMVSVNHLALQDTA